MASVLDLVARDGDHGGYEHPRCWIEMTRSSQILRLSLCSSLVYLVEDLMLVLR